MKIAIFGAHAGVHFLAKKLLEEETVEHVYHIPANPGIQPSSRYTPIQIESFDSIAEFLTTTKVDIVWITTINFLSSPRLQNFLAEQNIPVASCSFDHAQLEWCKATGKAFLKTLDIKTPGFKVLKKQELFDNYFNIKRPWVLKFVRDWRAGLQTIIINDDNYQQEFENLQDVGQTRFMHGFGNFNDQHFVVEEFLKGKREYSYHFICNEQGWEYLGSARDYKKFYEGDRGFNTASMGSYSPVDINPKVHEYADRIFHHLKDNGKPYTGIMYLGIMEDDNGEPYVLEINARPGDPEFQSILLTYGSDFSLSKLLYQCANNLKIENQFESKKEAVSVRLVHSRYRDLVDKTVKKDLDSEGIIYNPHIWPELPGMYINYNVDRRLLNAVISTSSSTKTEAANRIYKFLDKIMMYDFTYRKDIGYLE